MLGGRQHANAIAQRYALAQRTIVADLASRGMPITFVDPQPRFAR